jgi:DNA-binding response OmpR family regulator
MRNVDNSQFNILIVDDVPKNIQVLGNILRQEGYCVSFSTSGKQALELVQSDSLDLLLLDVMMPQMDGYEVCRKLKETPKGRGIPIIFITARTEREDILKGFAVGGMDYVTKPFDSPELLARVKTHLRLKQSGDRIRLANQELAEKNRELVRLNEELQTALKEIKTLRGILPICSYCRKIRKKDAPPERQDSWITLESYLDAYSEAKLSHSICPGCMQMLFPHLCPK